METAEISQPAEVSKVVSRLPLFWAERSAVWFAQAEVQFTLSVISSEKTKFCHVISQLDDRSAAEVEDIITSPSERDSHTRLKIELVTCLSPYREQRIRLFLTLERGDRKPSKFLKHLRSLAPHDFHRSIWSGRLPLNVRDILASQPEGDFDAAARCADRITEAAPRPATARVVSLPDSAVHVLLQHIEDLSFQLTALRSEWALPRPSSRNRRPGSRSTSRDDAASNLCW
jgi:hypothetical protein